MALGIPTLELGQIIPRWDLFYQELLLIAPSWVIARVSAVRRVPRAFVWMCQWWLRHWLCRPLLPVLAC
jgi:hypothetical protein